MGSGRSVGAHRQPVHHFPYAVDRTGDLAPDPELWEALRFGEGLREILEDFYGRVYEDFEIGDVYEHRPGRTITEADIVNFAGISGDYFYAHTDKIAAEKHHIFKQRVAHGYFVIAAAAGLFVWPGEGPVLANYGMDNLRFVEPVYIGDTIHLKLTCKRKTLKEPREDEPRQGEVEWDVEVFNQENVSVAVYTILTLVACKAQ